MGGDVVLLADLVRLARVQVAIAVGLQHFLVVGLCVKQPSGIWSTTIGSTIVVKATDVKTKRCYIEVGGSVYV